MVNFEIKKTNRDTDDQEFYIPMPYLPIEIVFNHETGDIEYYRSANVTRSMSPAMFRKFANHVHNVADLMDELATRAEKLKEK